MANNKDLKLGTSGSNFPPYPGEGQIPSPLPSWEGLWHQIPYSPDTAKGQIPGVCWGGCQNFNLTGTLCKEHVKGIFCSVTPDQEDFVLQDFQL